MAVSTNAVQVQWSSSNSTSVSSSGNATSDAATMSTTAIGAVLTVKADNGGTPASGDTVDFHVLYSTGDPDGASTDEYDTVSAANKVAVLDTNDTDPAQITVPILKAKALKVYAANNSSGRSITVSAEIYETTA